MTYIVTYVLVDGDASAVFGACADVQRLGRPGLRASDYPLGASFLVVRMPHGLELRLLVDEQESGVVVAIVVVDEVRPRTVRRGAASAEVLRAVGKQAADLATDLDGALRRRGLAARWNATRELALDGRGSSSFEGFDPPAARLKPHLWPPATFCAPSARLGPCWPMRSRGSRMTPP